MVIETCDSHYIGCVSHCGTLDLIISNIDTNVYFVWFVSNSGKIKQDITNANGIITVDLSTLNESSEYYISIQDATNTTVPIDINASSYDAVIIKTEVVQ